MARSAHPTYTAAERYERRHNHVSRRYRRHLTAVAIRESMIEAGR